MSDPEVKAAKIEGARAMPFAASDNRERNVAAIPVTTGSVALDILGDATAMDTPGVAAFLPRARSRFVKMTFEQDTYYLWSDDNAITIDETATGATTPRQQCDLAPSKVPVHEYAGGRYLIVKGAAAGRGRLVISSP